MSLGSRLPFVHRVVGGDKLHMPVKKLHSILRYAESSRGFTEIKQVSARSIQVCQGSMGFNAWNTFFLRVENLYIVRKLEKSLNMGELTFHAEKTACYRLQQETRVHV